MQVPVFLSIDRCIAADLRSTLVTLSPVPTSQHSHSHPHQHHQSPSRMPPPSIVWMTMLWKHVWRRFRCHWSGSLDHMHPTQIIAGILCWLVGTRRSTYRPLLLSTGHLVCSSTPALRQASMYGHFSLRHACHAWPRRLIDQPLRQLHCACDQAARLAVRRTLHRISVEQQQEQDLDSCGSAQYRVQSADALCGRCRP